MSPSELSLESSLGIMCGELGVGANGWDNSEGVHAVMLGPSVERRDVSVGKQEDTLGTSMEGIGEIVAGKALLNS